MAASPIHPPARDLLILSAESGWHTKITFGEDTRGAPFVNVTGSSSDPLRPLRFHVTWHTRATGTYRLFACMAGPCGRMSDRSLKNVKSLIQDTEPKGNPS